MVAEALAAGVPALISDQVNIWREIVRDGAGLVAKDSLPGTCWLLERYLRMQPEERLAMRRSAVACFEQRFEIQHAAHTLHAVLFAITHPN